MSEHTQPFTPEFTGGFTAQSVIDDPAPHTATPVVVPGVAQYLGRWRFVLVTAAVWIVAAAAGAGPASRPRNSTAP